MLLKALDLLRTLGWGVIDFIYSLIDSLFDILKQLNAFNIIDSLAGNSVFKNLHSGILAISLTLFGLFVIWKFVQKVMEPDEGPSIGQIVKEVFKCGSLIILSTFLFSEVAMFSIKLSGYTANIFTSSGTKLSDSMLELYVDYSDGYKASDGAMNIDVVHSQIENDSFTNGKYYNNKYVTNKKWILPDEKDYVFSINWIMATIVGAFFLYALFFSGMMLARRQIEFCFLFLISPIIFATSVCNKQRRSAVTEQLVSLVLQGAVVMLIINITALVMGAVNNTTFFTNNFMNITTKSLMFIGCASFLLTGSQVINRFIGGNVSANSGREQMMSLMGFGQTMSAVGTAGVAGTIGAGMIGLGSVAKTVGGSSSVGNSFMSKLGNGISNFGNKLTGIGGESSKPSSISRLGAGISSFGTSMKSFADKRINPVNKDGLSTKSSGNRIGRFGDRMMSSGMDNIQSAFDNIIPNRNMYRRRYRYRGE